MRNRDRGKPLFGDLQRGDTLAYYGSNDDVCKFYVTDIHMEYNNMVVQYEYSEGDHHLGKGSVAWKADEPITSYTLIRHNVYFKG